MTKFIIASLIAATVQMASAAEVKVTQKGKAFDQSEVTIKPGDTIVFFNGESGDVTHNVFSLGPKNPFELKTQKPGESSSVTFKEEGQTDVECAIHSGMKLKVNVKK